ncbi:hypothetical protein SUGI_0960850 [Cryptomeria japonica]|nr:hypothetical protein SUGI_0960850 [Cryptomeria japonica]
MHKIKYLKELQMHSHFVSEGIERHSFSPYSPLEIHALTQTSMSWKISANPDQHVLEIEEASNEVYST